MIDTTLAKLLAESASTPELLSLLAGANDVVLSELEPFLQERPYVLATVMQQQGRSDRVLELLVQCVFCPIWFTLSRRIALIFAELPNHQMAIRFVKIRQKRYTSDLGMFKIRRYSGNMPSGSQVQNRIEHYR